MCLVALFFQVFDDAALVLGANREELFARGGEPPRVLEGVLRAVGGVDPVAGGTWLGVNERGLLVAVTNRPKNRLPLRPPSRGLLARQLLGCTSASAAADRAEPDLVAGSYAGCNLLCADERTAIVVHAGNDYERRELRPGLHLLTANDVDDPADSRQEFARAWLGRRRLHTSKDCVAALKELCGLTGDAPMCLRTALGGTVSSSIIAFRRPLERSTYLHAQGPPDITPYADYAHLFRELARPDAGV
jgi:uncharacterized protein with NRDE domain